MHPLRIWMLSCRLHRRGFRRTARLLKAFNFMVFKAILPPEVQPGPNCQLVHHALGVGVHVQMKIGRDVTIYHLASFAAEAWLGADRFQVIGDRVIVGVGSILVGPITVGDDAVIGAGAVVVKDVPPGAVVAGSPARIISYDGVEINARRLGRPLPADRSESAAV
ncbi:MAG: hypothetical protein WAO61_10320 [Solirubrobacterales bacterium]